MVENYCNELKRLASKPEHKIGIIDYHKFLLVSFILNKVCFFTDYEFSNEEQLKDIDEKKAINEI
jgi:hypothetical protein